MMGCFLAASGAWWGGFGLYVDLILVGIGIAAGVVRTIVAYRSMERRGL